MVNFKFSSLIPNRLIKWYRESKRRTYWIGDRIIIIPHSSFWGICINSAGARVLDLWWFRFMLEKDPPQHKKDTDECKA